MAGVGSNPYGGRSGYLTFDLSSFSPRGVCSATGSIHVGGYDTANFAITTTNGTSYSFGITGHTSSGNLGGSAWTPTYDPVKKTFRITCTTPDTSSGISGSATFLLVQ